MARLLVHVEGQTEENFVNQLLRGYLTDRGYHSVSARLLGPVRQRSRRGGIRKWPVVRSEILRHLKEDASCTVTTMVDFYGLPRDGENAWPGRAQAAGSQPTAEKSAIVTQAILKDLERQAGGRLDLRRFVPFVIMHEFEGLLFSDCGAFGRGIGRPDIEPKFSAIRDAFPSPEDINDDPDTAPSKRVEALMRGYRKTLHGPLAASEIGLDAIREACPAFQEWLDRLVALV